MGHEAAPKEDFRKLKFGFKAQSGQTVFVREFEAADYPEVRQIFSEGMMEMIPDTSIRGLRHHPESVLLYTAMTGLLPAIVLCLRYFYSRRVVCGYLSRAMNGDMGDIEGFYMKSSGSCLWVAVLEGKVVGLVAAVRSGGGAVELQRMSVDRRYRKCGVAVVLGRKVLEFAAICGYSSVILGTTAYTPAAHRLYQRLGFRCVAVTNGYVAPGVRQSVLEWIFYRVQHHHYVIHLENNKMSSSLQ